MNIVIAAEKKYEKLFRDILKNENFNLIGYEPEMKTNFVRRIADHYNPHILVIVNGVRSRKFDFFASLSELVSACPTMRIIYLFGRISTNGEQQYLDTVQTFAPYGIYDVMPFDLYERGFKSRFIDLLKTPMTADSLQQLIADRQEEENTSEVLTTKLEKIIDNTPVKLDKSDVENTEYSRSTITVDEPPEALPEELTEHITIAIGTLSEKQDGCTTAAFEITSFLTENKQTAALFLDEETYSNYVSYHGINPQNATQGCEINNLIIFPIGLYSEKKNYVKFAVCDYGYSHLNRDSDEGEEYAAAEIKICLCNFDEWNIKLLEEYLNSPIPYLKEINYIFFPVSEKNFIKFSKQMVKGHCKAFRTESSPDYTIPCEQNKNTYKEIISKYVKIEQPKKRFGLF